VIRKIERSPFYSKIEKETFTAHFHCSLSQPLLFLLAAARLIFWYSQATRRDRGIRKNVINLFIHFRNFLPLSISVIPRRTCEFAMWREWSC